MVKNRYWNMSLKQTNCYSTRFGCLDFLSKKVVKVEIYPKMVLLIKSVGDDWWCICHFSLFRDFANVKGTFIPESNFNRIGHIIYIKIVNEIKSIFEVRQQLMVVIECHL